MATTPGRALRSVESRLGPHSHLIQHLAAPAIVTRLQRQLPPKAPFPPHCIPMPHPLTWQASVAPPGLGASSVTPDHAPRTAVQTACITGPAGGGCSAASARMPLGVPGYAPPKAPSASRPSPQIPYLPPRSIAPSAQRPLDLSARDRIDGSQRAAAAAVVRTPLPLINLNLHSSHHLARRERGSARLSVPYSSQDHVTSTPGSLHSHNVKYHVRSTQYTRISKPGTGRMAYSSYPQVQNGSLPRSSHVARGRCGSSPVGSSIPQSGSGVTRRRAEEEAKKEKGEGEKRRNVPSADGLHR